MDDRAKDRYLRKKYGISLDSYRDMLARQNWVCAICLKPPGKRALHVDHDHAWKKVKITTQKIGSSWHATASYRGMVFWTKDQNKRIAVSATKAQLLAASVRGALCWPCNRALQAFRDKPDLMRNAAQYLDDFQNPTGVNPPATAGERL